MAGRAAIINRLQTAITTGLDADALGRVVWMPDSQLHFSTIQDAESACTYKGRVQHSLLPLFTSGTFNTGANCMVANDVVQKWTAGTRDSKLRAVGHFLAYLRAVGTLAIFFPTDSFTHLDRPHHRQHQERALSCFALMRIMAGQTCTGALTCVSHVRTWCATLWELPFGNVGTQARSSVTTQCVNSLRAFFPERDTDDTSRLPVTWPMVKMFVTAAQRHDLEDFGVLIAVCYAGLYRMGELTCTASRPFDPDREVTEADLSFLPSFQNPDRVVIHLGPTKADQQGTKAKKNQRMLPVNALDPFCPGNLLRRLVQTRYRTAGDVAPKLGLKPLFQNKTGGHLRRDTVVAFMRRLLKQQGYQHKQLLRYSGHSMRIGGATRLFQLNADPEIFKRLGGWSSDAYKVYIRVQQEQLMEYSRKICK